MIFVYLAPSKFLAILCFMEFPQPLYCNSDSAFGYEYLPTALTESTLQGFYPRLGQLHCPHGSIATPNFVFCGTKANVKTMSRASLRAAGSDFILANTYHLLLRPGAELIAQQGGLHRFMRWDGPLLSDSGGYQVFAMGHGSVSEEIKRARKKASPKNTKAPNTQDASNNKQQSKQQEPRLIQQISEQGVTFRSYIDGRAVFLSPESSVQIQRQLGVDFMVQLDECTPYQADKAYTEASMELSLRWGRRSLSEFLAHDDGTQAIYGVVQGGIYADLRRRSVDELAVLPFFGSAIGGCLGKNRSQMWEVIAQTAALLPPERPIHLLGIGHIADIFWGVLQGIDTFDCVHPTRMARHGSAILPYTCGYSKPGLQAAQIHLRHSRFTEDDSPLFVSSQLFQEAATVPDELSYSKAYIRYLFCAKEMLGAQILTMNNVFQMNALMRDIRLGLQQGCFGEVVRYWLGLEISDFLLAVKNEDQPL